MKTVWRFCKKLKVELLYDPAVPPLGTYPKELKAGSQRGICTPLFTAALFIRANRWKQPKCPLTDKWIKKMQYTHAMKYYAALKKGNPGLPWWRSG